MITKNQPLNSVEVLEFTWITFNNNQIHIIHEVT